MPIYYTIQASNTTGAEIPLSFDINTTRPILEKPSDWCVGVIRFSIPNYGTPIYTFAGNKYSLSMTYRGFVATEWLSFVPMTDVTTADDYYAVYEIQQFVMILNKTIHNLFVNMRAQTVLFTLVDADEPYFHYSETTTLLSFSAKKSDFLTDGTVANPVQFYTNEALFQQIQGFPMKYEDNFGFGFLVQNLKNGNEGATYMTMTSQQPLLQQLTDFSGIILTSSLPVANEFLGYVSNSTPSGETVNGAAIQQISMPILSDYTPQGLTIDNFHEAIVYNAIVPYRQAEILSDTTMETIHIDVFISNVGGNMRRAKLPPNGSANIKLMFTPKRNNNYA